LKELKEKVHPKDTAAAAIIKKSKTYFTHEIGRFFVYHDYEMRIKKSRRFEMG
jgi:hypothetical protein